MTTGRRLAKAAIAPVASGLFGLLWLTHFLAWRILSPSYLEWLLVGDWAQHLLGWLYFRREPWTWPLGTFRRLLYPLGGQIAFTDSLPVVAFGCKVLGGWLPARFQYIGLWLATCFIAQGIVGALLARTWSTTPLEQFLIGSVFVCAPPLLARVMHDPLCAHWVLLAFFVLLSFEGHAQPGWGLALVVVAACVTPYIAVMALALYAAVLLGYVSLRVLTPQRSAAWMLAAGGLTVLVFVSFGLIAGEGTSRALGFGFLSADLATLWNPMRRSRLLPTAETGVGQYEGFGYLGAGVIGACLLAPALVFARDARASVDWRRIGPLVGVCLLLAIYALASPITFNGRPVLDLGSLYLPFRVVTSAFRASGRFVWPLHYAVMAGALWLVCRQRRAFVRAVLLAAILVVQVFDQSAVPKMVPPRQPVYEAPEWSLLAGYAHLEMYPPQVFFVPRCAQGAGYLEQWIPLAMVAWEHDLTFNGGYLGRIDVERFSAVCEAAASRIRRGEFDLATAYVVHPRWLGDFATATCGRLAGEIVCAAPADTPLVRYLSRHTVS